MGGADVGRKERRILIFFFSPERNNYSVFIRGKHGGIEGGYLVGASKLEIKKGDTETF